MRHFTLRELAYAIVFVVLLAAIYLLSGGPVIHLESKGYLPVGNPAIQAFYVPANWAYINSPLYRKYIHWSNGAGWKELD